MRYEQAMNARQPANLRQRMNEQIEKLQSDVGRIMNSLEVPGR